MYDLKKISFKKKLFSLIYWNSYFFWQLFVALSCSFLYFAIPYLGKTSINNPIAKGIILSCAIITFLICIYLYLKFSYLINNSKIISADVVDLYERIFYARSSEDPTIITITVEFVYNTKKIISKRKFGFWLLHPRLQNITNRKRIDIIINEKNPYDFLPIDFIILPKWINPLKK